MRPSWISDQNDFSYFDLPVISFVSEKEVKIDFQESGHFRFPIGTILTTFISLSPQCFQPNFKSIGLSVQERKRKNKFSSWRPYWNADWNDFKYFCSTKHPNASYQVSSHLAFRFRRRSELDFQDSRHVGHLGFPIGTILAISDLQVILMLPTKIQINWSFGSGEEAKIDFQDGGHLGFPLGTILAIFDLQVNWPFS